MNELTDGQIIPESGRPYRFKIELNGGTAKLYNILSTGVPEEVVLFNGDESARERRFNHEILEGEKWYFEFTGAAKAFYR